MQVNGGGLHPSALHEDSRTEQAPSMACSHTKSSSVASSSVTVRHSTLSYVAGVELVKQGDVEIGAHQQAETDLSKVAPFLLVVTRLREFRRVRILM